MEPLKTKTPFMHTEEAADYLGLNHRTMERWRIAGIGPVFRKHGAAVLYSVESLDAWSSASERQSTSEELPAGFASNGPRTGPKAPRKANGRAKK